jgi:hypothetical protein
MVEFKVGMRVEATGLFTERFPGLTTTGIVTHASPRAKLICVRRDGDGSNSFAHYSRDFWRPVKEEGEHG